MPKVKFKITAKGVAPKRKAKIRAAAKGVAPKRKAKIRAAARGVPPEQVGQLMAFGDPELAEESLGNRMAGMKKRFKRLSQTKLKKRG
jgi:hypothetical protein